MKWTTAATRLHLQSFCSGSQKFREGKRSSTSSDLFPNCKLPPEPSHSCLPKYLRWTRPKILICWTPKKHRLRSQVILESRICRGCDCKLSSVEHQLDLSRKQNYFNHRIKSRGNFPHRNFDTLGNLSHSNPSTLQRSSLKLQLLESNILRSLGESSSIRAAT